MSTIQVNSIATFDDTYKHNIPTECVVKGKVVAWANWTNSTTGLAPVLQNSYNVTGITNSARGRNDIALVSGAVPSAFYSGRGISYDNATSTPSAVFVDSRNSFTSFASIVEVDLGTTYTLEGRSSQTSVVLVGF
jgi:hypothetical protein